MTTVESRLEILKDIIDPLISNASPQKKKYAKDLFSDVITGLNKAELKARNLEAKLNGFVTYDDYLTEHYKALDILILMGAGDIPYDKLTYKNMRWICEHNDNQTRPFTFKEIYQLERMLIMFEGLEDRMPESSEELKNYFKND